MRAIFAQITEASCYVCFYKGLAVRVIITVKLPVGPQKRSITLTKLPCTALFNPHSNFPCSNVAFLGLVPHGEAV